MIRFVTVNEEGRHLAGIIERESIPFEGEAIVFIGALGICVRRIQGLIHDKATDPAVVCVDVTGRYVIPVLSGHIGGANGLARQIALVTGGEAVVTTQSDLKGLWALDTLARDYGWGMSRKTREEMNRIVATFVHSQPTALVVEWDDKGTRYLSSTLPPHVRLFHSLEEYETASASGLNTELLLIVSPYVHNSLPQPSLQYYPRVLSLGVGCQRGTSASAAQQIMDSVRQRGYAPEAIRAVATVEQKRHEPLLASLCSCLPWAQCDVFTADELAAVDVPHPSERVLHEVGCPSVAEAAALAAIADGLLVVDKQKGCVEGQHYTYAIACMPNEEAGGHIEIVGAGPGDPELVSVRGKRLLQQADLILYAGSLVPRQLTACAKSGATVRSSAGMTLEEQFTLMKSFYDRGCLVVRLHTGDPSIYGAIDEQMALFDSHGMHYGITPGISSFLAAAAELRSQLTLPGRNQTVILTRAEGRTSVPDSERLRSLAKHGSTLCIFLSAALADQVQHELLEGGLSPETPVAVCHRLTWSDQKIVRGKLKNLAQIVADHKLTLTTMIVVGEAIGNREGQSQLYSPQFSHLFRNGKENGPK